MDRETIFKTTYRLRNLHITSQPIHNLLLAKSRKLKTLLLVEVQTLKNTAYGNQGGNSINNTANKRRKVNGPSSQSSNGVVQNLYSRH